MKIELQTRRANSTYKLDMQTRHTNSTYKLDIQTRLSNSTCKLEMRTPIILYNNSTFIFYIELYLYIIYTTVSISVRMYVRRDIHTYRGHPISGAEPGL